VTGPFRALAGASGASPSTTLADAAAGETTSRDGDDGGAGSVALPLAGAAVAVGAVGAGALWLRARRDLAAAGPDAGDDAPVT
jgi:hypothetical protein